MNAPLTEVDVRPLAPLVDILRLMAESAAGSWELFGPELDLTEVVDPLQEFAERTGLVAAIGQDAVQEIIVGPFDSVRGLIAGQSAVDNYAAQLVRQWEMADPRDAWRHTGEPRPEPDGNQLVPERIYRTPQSTIDAFRYVVALDDLERLKTWLADHPLDAPFLLALLESPTSC
jgi:hypothetical protein